MANRRSPGTSCVHRIKAVLRLCANPLFTWTPAPSAGKFLAPARGVDQARKWGHPLRMNLDLRDPSLPEAQVRAALELRPHPEGGHYREFWRDMPEAGGRGAASSILFLLAAGERSHWHRIDAAEIWIWQAGAPLVLGLRPPRGHCKTIKLGPNAADGESFQGVVPPFVWQEASSLGAWTLVSCVVAPAFQFEGFELAPQEPAWIPAGPDDECAVQGSSGLRAQHRRRFSHDFCTLPP